MAARVRTEIFELGNKKKNQTRKNSWSVEMTNLIQTIITEPILNYIGKKHFLC